MTNERVTRERMKNEHVTSDECACDECASKCAGECACEKIPSSTKLAIQCKYCIGYSDNQYNHNKGHNCSCVEVEITNCICNICAEIRDKIDTLNEELDQLLKVW